MQILNSSLSSFSDKIELDDVVNHELIALMTQNPIHPDDFYLTGYETISFKRTREFALETVLSSVVPLDKELLIIANNYDDLHLHKLCESYEVSSNIVSLPTADDALQGLIHQYHQLNLYSHILISCDVNDPVERMQLRQIASALQKTTLRLIVHCRRNPLRLHEINELNIAYMVFNGTGRYISSVVVANRSQLVQTEGSSRSDKMDLHEYWQKTLQRRHAAIKPMDV
ncbi:MULTISPECIES: hypothetical protein [unclassified Carboxylicivirga]|uniref:hypothetical protein n=1 Tax=Carboxylicivirga TaxID=1628153 RepID=UPI003D32F530